MRFLTLACAAFLLLPVPAPGGDWKLVWSDEFL